MNAMLASDLPLPRIGRGKVRDIYAVGDDRVLLLTTDRISAFDVVMAETIPMKGAVLTQISAWWFRQLEGVVPHHMISADADEIIREVPELKNHRADILGRAMLCRRTTVFPVECVIRPISTRPGEYAARQARSPASSGWCVAGARRADRSSPAPRRTYDKTSRSHGCGGILGSDSESSSMARPSIISANGSPVTRASSSPTQVRVRPRCGVAHHPDRQ
jgi:hypothetical protein